MSKRKSYPVSLITLGHLKENLHFGDFSQYWWETRQTDNDSILYPIRINMKTLVILNKTHFFITIIEGHKDCLHKPGYICEANNLTSDIFDNVSAAVTTLYKQLFPSSETKFSGPLIIGHDKPEINNQLLTDVIFCPFNCMYNKFTIFIYGIGVSSDDGMCNVGPGFKSSFVCVIGFEKKKTLFVQEINYKNSIVKIYQDHKLMSTHVGSNPNDVWEKVGYLKNHKVPKCLPEEWNIASKMEHLWNYHLRKCTLASYEFWTRSTNPTYDCENLQFLFDSGFLNPFPKEHCNDGEILWDCFNQSIKANGKGYNGKKRILSIIAEKFPYRVIMDKLKISLSIKRHVQIGGEIQEGKDITSAIENVAGTSVAHIEPNRVRDKKEKEKSMTIPGISNWFEWSWPIE
ncbi:11_t:CDS:2, partial [Entrophospora sp. SA101]